MDLTADNGSKMNNPGQKLKGMLLFTLSMIVYSIATFLIKVTIQKCEINSYELTYYIALVCLCIMSLQIKFYNKSIENVPENLYIPITQRIVTGVLTDVFLFLSF